MNLKMSRNLKMGFNIIENILFNYDTCIPVLHYHIKKRYICMQRERRKKKSKCCATFKINIYRIPFLEEIRLIQ